MFSGKSEELVRRMRRAVIARQRVQVFKPATDTRHEGERLVTRDKRELDAESVADSRELSDKIHWGVQVVGIDEAQFFDKDLVKLVNELADAGKRVIVAGLDQDFRRHPFGPMPGILGLREPRREPAGSGTVPMPFVQAQRTASTWAISSRASSAEPISSVPKPKV